VLLEEAVQPVEMLARKKGLDLRRSTADDVPPVLLADPVRLRQILLNLVTNAIKFTKEGAIGVSVVLEGRFGNEAILRFLVTDTGIGLTPEQQRVIFEPFRQADGSTTRLYGGIGLGLSISRRLVKLMGGEIGVMSDAGQGSTFWFTARVGLTEEVRESYRERPSLAALQGASGEAPPRGLRILVAEDNRVNQRVVTALLERRGHKVVLAENGAIALQKSAAEYFDVVLMDVQMPEMDGLTALRLLRERDAREETHTPVIVLTAHAMQGDRERFLAAGADGYVAKPIQIEHLNQAIDAALNSPAPACTI
jgi:CheY-like chemotaxis protein